MLNISKFAVAREIQVHLTHSTRYWVGLVATQNVRAKKSFAFEPNMQYILKSLRELLACTDSKAHNIYEQYPTIRSMDMMTTVGSNIKILMKIGVSSETVIENPFLLVMEEDDLMARLEIVKNLKLTPKLMNDFVPLLEMKEDRLKKVCDLMTAERTLIPGGNRIYYLSHKLKIEPKIVAKYCVKNDYALIAPFETVNKKIQILLDYNITPLSILKTMYALDRSEEVYVSRLEQLMSLNREDVKMWLFKCADDVFDKYLSKMRQKNSVHAKQMIEHKGRKKIQIETELNEMLECDSEDAAHIYYNQISHFDQIDSAKQNIEFLQSRGVSLETITANSVFLTMPLEQLEEKCPILDGMDPRHIDDLIPLICVEKNELQKFQKTLEDDELYDLSDNPIYYFSEKLRISPSLIASHFSKNPSIFLRSPKQLCQKLDLLLSYNVESRSILDSAETFRMSANKIENRLNELKSHSIQPIFSWMLTTTEKQLRTKLEKQDEQMKLLDGCNDSLDYITKRLNWDESAKEKALKVCPSLKTYNVSKVQKLLDFLLNETHFTEEDISSYPRVFRNKLEKLKIRLEELSTVGYKPERLYIICLEQKRYLEAVEKYCENANDMNVWINYRKIEKRIKEKK